MLAGKHLGHCFRAFLPKMVKMANPFLSLPRVIVAAGVQERTMNRQGQLDTKSYQAARGQCSLRRGLIVERREKGDASAFGVAGKGAIAVVALPVVSRLRQRKRMH